ncbi:diaminopimelate epimerase [bacterium BMS3Abin03]|nr:diaminopimelate epimerase [bacterium BMS3Abin03]
MSGAGNDFILINRSQNPEFVLSNNVISRLCDRRNGIGADGIITIKNSPGFDFEMDYFNADGSTGTLCGNGARCSIKFACNNNLTKSKTVNFLSNGQKYSGELLSDEQVKFNLKPPADIKLGIIIETGHWQSEADYLHTGSPHVVINLAEQSTIDTALKDFPVEKIGREIRHHKDFAPGGTNVNFMKIENGRIIIRSYERGVEAETLACGTGAVAAAVIAYLKYNLIPPVSLLTQGGEILNVDFVDDNGNIKNVSLTGPAKEIFKGEFLLDNFS